ncbi:MAG: hypothetical protein COW88_00225 [Candidatus Lloydbacteria bacterium CG22_combo_CG10-13_8_21_14_all_47_15]|uniref:Prepilin-type N-terminal cleavage/methylation domain-containing protein n=1 Tax=Candidatus Lloydbacteria bacterium CG22_combo_CG10-13_8_21_14_all_47_15 TaxID=1974635 RepID=A0A2H0CX47_9BACT|nr:MAG: hypothetical protein COW88_00225 [Candidatus Lloydbacteria bacterium CG22_combo_CG10-13_8_21_14_all_47_15]
MEHSVFKKINIWLRHRAYLPETMSGFALIETLVAITVLVAGLTGPLSFTAQSIAAAQEVKQQVTAFFLMVEGAEHVRQTRDSNMLALAPWLSGLEACFSGVCDIDVSLDSVIDCPGGACAPLFFEEATGRYGHGSGSGWTQTQFTRTISVTETEPDREAKVLVTVEWFHRDSPRSITAEADLFNWQQ